MWLRLLAAVGMVGCSVVSTRLGCGGNRAVVPLPRLGTFGWPRHDAKVAEAKQRAGAVKLLFVGDSITQNYERSEEPYRNFLPIWDELFAPRDAMNLGFSGDCTYHVLWRLRHGEVDGLAPRDIVVLIGTNNLNPRRLAPRGETAEQVSTGILAVVDDLHKRMPAARVLVLSILPTGYSGDRTTKTDAANGASKSCASAKLFVCAVIWMSAEFLWTEKTGARRAVFTTGWKQLRGVGCAASDCNRAADDGGGCGAGVGWQVAPGTVWLGFPKCLTA